MWIPREISTRLSRQTGIYIQILIGPRQCGKSSLLSYLGQGRFEEVTCDDFQTRDLAERDPAFFMSQHPPPVLIDEVQYAPNIFPELKRIVDRIKQKRLFESDAGDTRVIIRLTGSNQILMDRKVKETLVGRASYYYLHTLSVSELTAAFPDLPIGKILFQGGWPELYTNPELSAVGFLNDYIRNYIEKDLVLSAGIEKHREFHTVLGMLAARTGELLNVSSLAKDAGVRSVTVAEWVSLLERTNLLYLLKPHASNTNKRLIKTPKLYFLDTGLAVRLQGWSELKPLMISSQAGHLFETLVLSEIVKFMANHGKDWNLSLWRTKDKEEIDFVVETGNGETIALDAKMGIHAVVPEPLPPAFKKAFPQVNELVLVSIGGERQYLSRNCIQVPVHELASYLAGWV